MTTDGYGVSFGGSGHAAERELTVAPCCEYYFNFLKSIGPRWDISLVQEVNKLREVNRDGKGGLVHTRAATGGWAVRRARAGRRAHQSPGAPAAGLAESRQPGCGVWEVLGEKGEHLQASARGASVSGWRCS